jgi:hypothetical protein
MTTEASTGSAVLTAITRYPVKSCHGQELTESVVEPWGLAGDRRWMLIDEAGVAVTARECPGLLRVVPQVAGDSLLLDAPQQPPMQVAVPVGGRLVTVRVWDDVFEATLVPGSAADWFSEVAGRAVRLVYLDDPRRRPTDPLRSRVGDVVSLADGYPMLLASTESLGELNRWVEEGPRAGDGPLPMSRFRPNLVISGTPAWAEDRWRRVRVGQTTFRSAKACDRCVLTLVDPETGRRTKEPLFSLARHRQWDHKTWFAVNLIAENPGTTLRLGDSVEVLEQSGDSGPQR